MTDTTVSLDFVRASMPHPAEANMAYTPSIFMVSWPDTEIHVLFTHSFNRCCGGWEAAIDWGGDQDGLPDGPARDASETEIVDWIEATVRRARNMVEKKSA